MNAAPSPAPPPPATTPTDLAAERDTRNRVVVLAGSATTLLALAGVFLAARHGENIMGWYANYVIPAGAILVGLVAASGYGVAAWMSGLKMTRRLIWSVVLELALSYFIAQYEQYSHFYDDASLGGFLRWFDESTRAFAWADHAGKAGEPFGVFGYAMRALEVGGFVVGGALIPLGLRAKPYCDPCRTYKRSRALTALAAGARPGLLGRAKADSRGVQEQAMADLDAIFGAAEQGDRAGVHREVAARGIARRAAAKLSAYVRVRVVRCPRCSDGGLDASLMVRHGNQWRETKLRSLPLRGDAVRALFD